MIYVICNLKPESIRKRMLSENQYIWQLFKFRKSINQKWSKQKNKQYWSRNHELKLKFLKQPVKLTNSWQSYHGRKEILKVNVRYKKMRSTTDRGNSSKHKRIVCTHLEILDAMICFQKYTCYQSCLKE
jgi:hypothetical protein